MKEIILEKTINQLINDKIVDFSSLNNKTIVLTINDINLDFCFYVNQNKIFIFSEKKPADTTIQINFLALKDLLRKKELTELIREDKIIITGEVKTAQLLIDLLKSTEIKNKLFDLLPNNIINLAKKIKNKIQNGELKNKIINTLIQPKVYK